MKLIQTYTHNRYLLFVTPRQVSYQS